MTVQTKAEDGLAATAFGQRSSDPALADSGRPVWVLDEGPAGGDVATVDSWSAGTLGPGETKELVWKLVATKAGTYTIDYSVSPGLTGRAQAAQGDTKRLLRGHDRRRARPRPRGRGRRGRARVRVALTLTAFGPLGPASES